MKLHQFTEKWYHPCGAPLPELEELGIRLIPNSDSYDPLRPTSEVQFEIDCTVCIGVFPRVRESIESTILQGRKCDEVVEQLLDQLDRSLSRHESEAKGRWPLDASVDRPVLTIVTGAGFSAGFGLPITAGLRGLIQKPCDRPGCPQRCFGVLKSFDPAAYPITDFLNGGIPDIEYLLTVWEAYRGQLQQADRRAESTHQMGYRRFVEHVCRHLYSLSLRSRTSHGSRFARIADWLRRAKEAYDVRFITFNYDLLLEMLCQEAGFPFVYAERRDPNTIPIRKLHGSANWQLFPSDQPPAPDVPMIHLYRSGQESIYAFPDVATCPYGSSAHMPVLIPPAAGKNYRGVYEWIWTLAAGDLAAADKLLVVGYSFPPLDAFARHNLVRILRNRGKPLTYVLLGDPAQARVRDLLSAGHVGDVTLVSDRWQVEHFEQML